MRKLVLSLLLPALAALASAQEVTFTKDIASIIYNQCTQCHRPGEIGPFPMTKYAEVEPWAQTIKYVTAIRYMPPWKADPHYSRFLGERFLTDEQIALIAEWADNGAPYGNAAEEPPLPDFPSGSQVGTPDLVLSMAESFEHVGGNQDEYRVFVLPTGLTENKQIAAVELRPGNPSIVHHALFTYDETGQARARDLAEPGYGYDGFGGFGIDGWWAKMMPGYVPGQKPVPYPEGLGQVLPAGSDFLIQMHYGPYPVPSKDSSTLNIFFKQEPVVRQVQNFIFVPFEPLLQNPPFVILPNTVKTFHCAFTPQAKVSVFAIWPHAHLICQSYEVYTVDPQGDTTNFIRIPDWDFNWQGVFNFKKYMVVEPGTTIHVYATYDNTNGNPGNPNDPPALMTWGERTVDEMLFLPISFVPYFPGDEDIVFDDETTAVEEPGLRFVGHHLAPVVPNPASGTAYVNFVLELPDHITIRVLDMQGRVMDVIAQDDWMQAGAHTRSVSLANWPAGNYFVQMEGTNFIQAQKLIVNP